MLRTMKRLTALSLGTRTPDDSQRTRLTCWLVERGGEKERAEEEREEVRGRSKEAADRRSLAAIPRAKREKELVGDGPCGRERRPLLPDKWRSGVEEIVARASEGSRPREQGSAVGECGGDGERKGGGGGPAAADRPSDALFIIRRRLLLHSRATEPSAPALAKEILPAAALRRARMREMRSCCLRDSLTTHRRCSPIARSSPTTRLISLLPPLFLAFQTYVAAAVLVASVVAALLRHLGGSLGVSCSKGQERVSRKEEV